MAIDWGRIGAGLQGFSEGFFPAYEARALTRYRDAQTAQLLQQQKFLEQLRRLEEGSDEVPISVERRRESPDTDGSESPPQLQVGRRPPATDIQIGELQGGKTATDDLRRRLLGPSPSPRPPGQFPQSTVSFGQPQDQRQTPLGRGLTRAFQAPGGQISSSDPVRLGRAPQGADTPSSPLLRQFQASGFARPPVQEPLLPSREISGYVPLAGAPILSPYKFIRSGTPEARQLSGDGIDVISQLPKESFGGGPPLWTEDTRRGDIGIPLQFDPREEQKRLLAAGAGMAPSLYPQVETPEYTLAMPFLTNLTSKLADLATAKPTAMAFTNEKGQQVTVYSNIDALLNAGIFQQARGLPGIGPLLEKMKLTGDVFGPTSSLDSVASNNYQIETNASVTDIRRHAGTSPMDAHNPVQRFIRENPLGPHFEESGPFGRSITTTNIPQQSLRVLENMVPIANVAQQIGDLALSLNTQENAFLAGVQGMGQHIDRIFDTNFWTPTEEKPLTEKQINKLWDDMNPTSTTTQRAQGLSRIRQLSKLRHSYAGIFAEMGGERGRKTEQDVERALKMVPGAGETADITESMLDTLFTNMINTYESITKGVIVTLGEFGLLMGGGERVPTLRGGVMGGVWDARQQLRQKRDERSGEVEEVPGVGRGQARPSNRP